MQERIKKNIVKIIFSIVFLLTGFLCLFIFSQPRNYYTVEKTVDSIKIEDVFHEKKANISFKNDAVSYICYQSDGLEIDKLNDIKENTLVTITLDKHSFSQSTEIIYVMKEGDTVLFDVSSYYEHSDRVTATLLFTIPLFISFYLLGTMILPHYRKKNDDSFTLSQPKWMFDMFFLYVASGLLFTFESFIFFFIGYIEKHDLSILYVGGIFFLLGAIELLYFFRHKIIYKNNTFYIVSWFKTKAIKKDALYRIFVTKITHNKLYFLDHNSNVLVHYKNTYDCLKSPQFMKSISDPKISLYEFSFSPINRKKRKMLMDAYIKASSLTLDKEYERAYWLYETIMMEEKTVTNIRNTIYAAIENKNLDKANELFQMLSENKPSDHINHVKKENKVDQIRYMFACYLAECGYPNEAKKHLDYLIDLCKRQEKKKEIFGNLTADLLVDLIDKIYPVDNEEKQQYLKEAEKLK